MGGGRREKRKPPAAKREKGKQQPRDVDPELTRHTHRAHARMTRNDFPVELSPPTSDDIIIHIMINRCKVAKSERQEAEPLSP